MIYQAGDIIILVRPKRNVFSFVWTMLKQFFTFFILNRGLIEAVDIYYHIKMAANSTMSVSMEPPVCRYLPIEPNVRVWRLKNKPPDFDAKFEAYVKSTLGRPFDWWKFLALVLDGIFGTSWFGLHALDENKDVCNEWVGRFYARDISVPCCDKSPEASIPGNSKGYMVDHPEIFEELR